MKDPRTHFTRGIVEAVERTPEFEAMFTDGQVIPNTWGNLAAQLIEGGHVEPTLPAACDFLGISKEDINDPTLLGHPGYDHASAVRQRAEARWVIDYEEVHQDDDKGYLEYLNAQLVSWRIEDADEQADHIQDEIEDLELSEEEAVTSARQAYTKLERGVRIIQRDEIFAKADRLSQDVALLCLKRDAIASGIAVSFNDFVANVFAYTGESPPAQERIVLAIGEVIGDLVENEHDLSPDMSVSELTLGEEQITEFITILAQQQHDAARNYAAIKWNFVNHLFYAGDYLEHPLFTGKHDN